MSYNPGMSNIQQLHPSADTHQVAFAHWLRDLLEAERWSVNKASVKVGMSKSTLASRFRGETPFLADELAPLAKLAGIDPVMLYRIYIGEEEMFLIDVKLNGIGWITDIFTRQQIPVSGVA